MCSSDLAERPRGGAGIYSAAASSAGAPSFSAICFSTQARAEMGASMVPRTWACSTGRAGMEARAFTVSTAPIAYVLFREKGLLGYSYFISLQSSYKTLYKVGQRPVEENEDIFRALGTYMAKLHEAEVYHADFSPGNVLYDRTEEGVKFSLIDINRMHFGPVSLKRGCANFSRLWGREAAFRLMAETYAESRHFDKAECLRWILYYRNRFWKRYALKHEIEFEL